MSLAYFFNLFFCILSEHVHPFMYVTSDWKRGSFRSRSLFPKKTFQRFQSSIIRMTNSVFFFHLPMLGFFCIGMPFAGRCTFFLLSVYVVFVRGLSLRSHTVPIFFYFGFLCYMASLLVLLIIFFPFTCMLIILSCFFSCTIMQLFCLTPQ